MILFDKSVGLNLVDFGIAIPALYSRKTRTVEHLLSKPKLIENKSSWLLERFAYEFSADDFCSVHSKDYIGGFFDHRVREQLIQAFELVNPDGSYNRWTPESAKEPLENSVPRLFVEASGAYNACRIALERGFCHYLGGGTHHAHRDFGHGFCPLNDSAVAAGRLIEEKRIKRAWIIDIDAHKGDGTAAIFHKDDRVATFSIHMAKGWPLGGCYPPDHPSLIPSDIDVPVEDDQENNYLEMLSQALSQLKLDYRADIAIVLAGSDPWEGDELNSTHTLNLSMDTLLERDKMVYGFLESAGLPSAWLMAGGYGQGAWMIHTQFLLWVLGRKFGMSEDECKLYRVD